jgi:hypothetical protein
MKDVNIRVGDVYPVSDTQVKQIKDALDAGYPVLLHIDYNPKDVDDDMHWVVAVAYNPSDENDFTIVDPIDGTLKSLKKYLGWFRPSFRRTVIDYCLLIGKAPLSANLKETTIDFDDGEGKRHEVGWYVYEWFTEKSNALKATGKYEQLSNTYLNYKNTVGEELINKQTEITKATENAEKLQKKIDTLTEASKKQADKITELNAQLVSQTNYTATQIIDLILAGIRKWLEDIVKGGVKK